MEGLTTTNKNQTLAKVQGQSNLPTWLCKELTNLPQREILEVKYQSKRICELSDSELWIHSPALLVKLNIITGWTIPNDDHYILVLTDQLIKKLKEDYSTLNIDEIEYAFRKYGTTIKDWGKSVNLSLIDSVLDIYIDRRLDASKIEEGLKGKSEFEVSYMKNPTSVPIEDFIKFFEEHQDEIRISDEDLNLAYEFYPYKSPSWIKAVVMSYFDKKRN